MLLIGCVWWYPALGGATVVTILTQRPVCPSPPVASVRRVAGTPHYDGVIRDHAEPVIIAICGMGPVGYKLVDPSKPGWRPVGRAELISNRLSRRSIERRMRVCQGHRT